MSFRRYLQNQSKNFQNGNFLDRKISLVYAWVNNSGKPEIITNSRDNNLRIENKKLGDLEKINRVIWFKMKNLDYRNHKLPCRFRGIGLRFPAAFFDVFTDYER